MGNTFKGTVYRITNKFNDMKYVGITYKPVHIRWRTHKSIKGCGAPFLKKAFIEFGVDNFLFEVIDTAKTYEELEQKEKFWIKHLNTLHPTGYNYLEGGFTNRAAIEKLKVKVRHVPTGIIYDSIIDAESATGIPRYSIGFCCTGRQDLAGGTVFEYVDKEMREKATQRKEQRKINRLKNKEQIRHIQTGKIYYGYVLIKKELGANINSVKLNCRGILDHANGHDFEFVDPIKRLEKYKNIEIRKQKETNKILSRKQIRIISTGEIYFGHSEVARIINSDRESVKAVCEGKRNTANGFRLEYVDLESQILASEEINKRKQHNIEVSKGKALIARNIMGQPIKCIELDTNFNSLTEAGKILKINRHTIARSLKRNCATKHGYTFIYIEKGDKNGK